MAGDRFAHTPTVPPAILSGGGPWRHNRNNVRDRGGNLAGHVPGREQ